MKNAVVFVSLALMVGMVIGESAQAQGTLRARKVQGPPMRISVGSHTAKSAPQVIYANTLLSGYFGTPNGMQYGNPWIDHAVADLSGGRNHVTELTFGYDSSDALPGHVVDLSVYDGYTGFCGSCCVGGWVNISITGLPGANPGGGGWIVDVDLAALGACFYLDNIAFGYAIMFADSNTGPLLATGGLGNLNRFDWTWLSSTSCGSWWFGGTPWAGFYLTLSGHDGYDTFAGGCGGGLGLEVTGPVCQGSTVDLTVTGEAGAFWALGVGTTIGAGVGGSLNGCPIDLIPIGGIHLMGRLPATTITFPANVTFGSGRSVGIQLVSKGTAPVWDSSPTEILHVP